jgi:hypothetical protein
MFRKESALGSWMSVPMTGETFKILASPADTADQLKLLIERKKALLKHIRS